MSELRGVMLVESAFAVQPEAAVNYSASKREILVSLMPSDEQGMIVWRADVFAFEKVLVSGRCQYIPEFAVAEHPSPVAIDTAIAQAYDAFCLHYDLWRRASHIEWLPVLPMSLGVEPGQRSGTWKFSAAPAPKATAPTKGRKQKQHGTNRNDRTAGERGASKRSKRR